MASHESGVETMQVLSLSQGDITIQNPTFELRGKPEDQTQLRGEKFQALMRTLLSRAGVKGEVRIIPEPMLNGEDFSDGLVLCTPRQNGSVFRYRNGTGSGIQIYIPMPDAAGFIHPNSFNRTISKAFTEMVEAQNAVQSPTPSNAGAQVNGQSGAPVSQPDVQSIGERIKAYREAHGLSVSAFAKLARCGPDTIDNIEIGVKPKRGNALEKIAAVLAGKAIEDEVDDALTFNATTEKFIALIGSEGAEKMQLDELLRVLFNRWSEGRELAESRDFVISMLRKHLAAISEDDHLEILLELRDYMKGLPKK